MRDLLFSELIFEAIVTDVDYDQHLCTINPLSVNPGSPIQGVPIPNYAMSGNSGIFVGLEVGTRVVATSTSGRGSVSTVIISIVPKYELKKSIFNSSVQSNVPSGTSSYPELKNGRITIKGGKGNSFTLNEDGDSIISSYGGSGFFVRKNGNKSSITTVSEDVTTYSSSTKTISGPVRRLNPSLRNIFPREDRSEISLYADTKYAKYAKPLGFFSGDESLLRSYSSRKRNPSIAEHRTIINEFSTSSQFTGFDDEIKRFKGDASLFEDMDTHKRNREQGNTLHLAEHELVEIIGGNLVDINGNILDINHRSLSYGGPNNSVPKKEVEESFYSSKRISRRGVGYHFQLSTNSSSSDLSRSDYNFIYNIDKEGVLKVNIPSSSDTGNIPFASYSDYLSEGEISVNYKNPSTYEPVPVILRDEEGNAILPGKNSNNIYERKTGVRFSDSNDKPYFPSESESYTDIRVNTTKYHNIYAAAERLIGSTISKINIPNQFVDKDGYPEDIPVGKPFEILYSSNYSSKSENDFPSYMSTVSIKPGNPAIYTGGDTTVCGVHYGDKNNKPYSNYFNLLNNGEGFNYLISDEYGEKRTPSGGRSANINLEGLLELSVGSDNYDNKSIVLDTEGSMVTWLGKDRNNRSMIFQSDGEVLFNIGGTYDGNSKDSEMNIGRFELRVNVTDKGFVGRAYETNEDIESSSNTESDFIISISENGIVIAGTKAGCPMVLRNEDSILIESGAGDVILKGTQVKTVEPKGRAKTPRSSGR